mmetsp:Transcript_12197/g.28254  ORF Transcript_12197/g.28254 Transcript_12197/m.28254 type:complete len:118 (-) Transcript_12197:588-941(-)
MSPPISPVCMHPRKHVPRTLVPVVLLRESPHDEQFVCACRRDHFFVLSTLCGGGGVVLCPATRQRQQQQQQQHEGRRERNGTFLLDFLIPTIFEKSCLSDEISCPSIRVESQIVKTS